ncbi:MAG TPA: hypothetical protein VLK36_01855 [Gaiellaceae bacterium]|nr:hypothetical protein [Gaiellaceae bacterium]
MRLRISLALFTVLAAIGVLAIGVGSAGATVVNRAPDPQTTNIPYLAWAGEEVKVVKCIGGPNDAVDVSALGSASNINALLAGKFRVEDWSGVDEVHSGPVFLNDQDGSVVGTYEQGRLCFSVHVTSQKPGLAVIKLAVSPNLLTLVPGLDPILKHQFLVIWMQDQAPVISEAAGANLGDPTGNGIFNPIPSPNGNYFGYGLIHVLVKGTFPLGLDFSGLGHPTVTLPDDWAWLAQHFAVDDSLTGSNFPGAAASRWDIHDDDAATEGHVASSFCTDLPAAAEAVDNCLGTPPGGDPDLGPFSNIYGGVYNAMGPFDPIRGFQTLLSDGKLDAGDAPMPALRVDVTIGAGSTVGTLDKADKSLIYSRDGLGSGKAHNLYAPFYKALIPAALPDDRPDTSGVAGAISNNFTGFLGFTGDPVYTTEQVAGIYDYWDTFTTSFSRGNNACKDVLGRPIPLPTGKTGVAVYTDEHGEAYVKFIPDSGIVLTPDSNGRCDIYGPAPVGHATISAVSVYPDQPVLWDQSSKTSNVLAKTVNFASSKVLNCIPKSTNEAYCVETVKDLWGNPVRGAQVEFSAQSFQGSEPVIGPDARVIPPYDTTGQGANTSTDRNFVDITTNGKGMAGIFVRSTTGSCIDVVSENVGTRNGGDGIFRSVDFNPTTGAACGTTTAPPGAPGGGSTGTSGGTSGSSGATAPVTVAAPVAVSSPVPTAASAPAATAKTMTLASARVVKIGTNRVLLVRVNGAAKTAKLHITMIGKVHGKVTRTSVTRTVATNKQVRVPNLKLAPSVRSVKVGLV